MKKTILIGTLAGLIALNLVGTGAREITMLEKEIWLVCAFPISSKSVFLTAYTPQFKGENK